MKQLSTKYRYINIFLACFQNMTLGGIFYGWASISGTLLISSTSDGGAGLTSEYVHMMFVVASFFNFLGPVLLGIVLDLYGPRICSILSIMLIALGCGVFGISNQNSLPLFVPGMCLIAFGGPGTQNAIIHLSNLFPDWKATATAFITGSFQLSFMIFLIFDQLWMHLDFSYRTLFIGYSVVCLANILISLFMWPDEPYSYDEQLVIVHSESKDDLSLEYELPEHTLGLIRLPSTFVHDDESDNKRRNHRMDVLTKHSSVSYGSIATMDDEDILINNATTIKHNNDKNHYHDGYSEHHHHHHQIDSVADESEASYDNSNTLKDATLYSQLISSEFLNLAVFFLVNSFWANFYIGTFDMQLGDGRILKTAPTIDHNYGRLFTLALTCGVPAIPVVGALMDIKGFPTTSVLTITCGLIWALLLLYSTPTTLLASFAFYSLYRTFFFTFFFAYLADTLGFRYFGMLAGVIFLFAGILGMLQYPLAELAAGTCHSLTVHSTHAEIKNCNKGHWFLLNSVMTVTIASTYYFSYQDSVRRRKVLQTTLDKRYRNNNGSDDSCEL